MTAQFDYLKDVQDEYDVIVVGSGLAGLTAANQLGKAGHRVLLLEHHYNLGGMAMWFKRKGGHIFDISLHGFPYGMIKSCRKYWNKTISDSIVQLKGVRFDNPQFQFETTYDMVDFKDKMVNYFKIPKETVENFFDTVRNMEYYDDQTLTTRQLFERFFPGREDVQRLLIEPMAYANGSTLDDPAITFGIVFSNFMSKGVYTFQGGTDVLIREMRNELKRNNVDYRTKCKVEKIVLQKNKRKIEGVLVNGRFIKCRAVVSNAHLKTTIFNLIGAEHFDKAWAEEANAVRNSSSSSQVYMGIRKGESIDFIGDLFFTSSYPKFETDAFLSMNVTSRTFSTYYPDIRPGSDRYAIVSSANHRFEDWNRLTEEEYKHEKEVLIEETLKSLEHYVPNVRDKIDHVEAATPKTFVRYTYTHSGATFGTKFEGLKISQSISEQIEGVYHAGSVGIIMSGWLGTINYGVITANVVDRYLHTSQPTSIPVNPEEHLSI